MKHALVIGGGFGGMAAALRLRAKNYKVTVVDRGKMLGGRGQVFEKNGFKHDAGPTVITAPFLLEELFELFNEKHGAFFSSSASVAAGAGAAAASLSSSTSSCSVISSARGVGLMVLS